MNQKAIFEGLKEFDQNQVSIYIAYLVRLETEKKKEGQNLVVKNPWMKHKSDTDLMRFFKMVAMDGLIFDGIEITLQKTGISYSYQAFKNKMFLAYPESVIDVSLVYDSDEFNFSKVSGHVEYTHKIGNPFSQDIKGMTGAYCVIKNKRGEFLTLLSATDIEKHRKVAKTDYIWQKWPKEMALKTIIKKACKSHFKDIYQNIETIDNENYDIDQSFDIEIEHKAAIENIKTVEELEKFWKKNLSKSDSKKDFNKLVSSRKEELTKEAENADS